MGSLANPLEALGRLLLGVMFVLGFVEKIGNMEGFTQYMVAGGLPAFMAWPAVLFELLAGSAVILGFQTRIAALLLAGFCVVTAVLYHISAGDPTNMIMAMKNFAIAGGMLVLAVHGAGPISIDARRKR